MKKWNDTYPETPYGFHNRVEMTLAGLEEREMKKTFARTPVLVFALIAVMLAATAFAATQLLGGYLDWDGTYTPIEETPYWPEPTLSPAEAADYVDLHEYLPETIPDGEYWEVWDAYGGCGEYGAFGPRFTILDELAEYIADTPMQAIGASDEWTIDGIYLNYNTIDMEMELISDEQVADGIRLTKRLIPEVTTDDLHGYSVTFVDDEGERLLSVDASLIVTANYEDADGSFFLAEGANAEFIEVEGFDRALVIMGVNDYCQIELQKDIDGGERLLSYSVYSYTGIPAEELIDILFK